MRDALLVALLVYSSFRALREPWIGVIAWTIVSIMSPHRLTWGLDELPVAAIVGGATLVGIVVSGERGRSHPWSREQIILALMMLWFTLTSFAALNTDNNLEQWKKVMKIDFMILVALFVMHSKKHIIALAWALVISVGFYGFKGGIFTLMSAGAFHVWGPPGSYIEGNNEIALALIITIPLMRFLQLNSANRWIGLGLSAGMVLSAVAALGTQSRGALLALVAMALMFWWRGPQKIRVGLLLLLLGAVLLAFMPSQWANRMGTIQTYDQDASALGRINAWSMAWNLASSNFLGGGFDVATVQNFALYAPVADDVHAAHSIYFQILGEHGFVGLLLFVLLWICTWLSAARLRNVGSSREETRWLSQLGAMVQVSLIGYAVGGAFLSLAYFDLPYNVMILVVLGCRWHERKGWVEDAAAAPITRSRLDWSASRLPPDRRRPL